MEARRERISPHLCREPKGGVGCCRRSIASPNARTMSLGRTRSSWPRVWSAKSRAAIPTAARRASRERVFLRSRRSRTSTSPASVPSERTSSSTSAPSTSSTPRQCHVPRPARYGEDPLGRGLKESAPVRRDTWALAPRRLEGRRAEPPTRARRNRHRPRRDVAKGASVDRELPCSRQNWECARKR
jgi:hypothetical protein